MLQCLINVSTMPLPRPITYLRSFSLLFLLSYLQDIQKGLLRMDSSVLKEMLPDDDIDKEVHLIAHTKLAAQDSLLSTSSDFGDEPSSPNEIIIEETIQEEREGEEGGGGREELQKAPPVKRIGSDGGDDAVEDLELKQSNHVGGGGGEGEKKKNGIKETNVDNEEKHLSPIEKKLSKQELFEGRPTVKRNRFTTQRDPFHKDRVPRKSVLKRHEPSPVTIEARSPSTSPTGNGSAGDIEEEDDEITKYHQQQMDRKCCVVM
jgi:hypothetical protein